MHFHGRSYELGSEAGIKPWDSQVSTCLAAPQWWSHLLSFEPTPKKAPSKKHEPRELFKEHVFGVFMGGELLQMTWLGCLEPPVARAPVGPLGMWEPLL